MRVWHVLTVRGSVHCLHAQREGGKELLGLRLVKKSMDETSPAVALR